MSGDNNSLDKFQSPEKIEINYGTSQMRTVEFYDNLFELDDPSAYQIDPEKVFVELENTCGEIFELNEKEHEVTRVCGLGTRMSKEYLENETEAPFRSIDSALRITEGEDTVAFVLTIMEETQEDQIRSPEIHLIDGEVADVETDYKIVTYGEELELDSTVKNPRDYYGRGINTLEIEEPWKPPERREGGGAQEKEFSLPVVDVQEKPRNPLDSEEISSL